MTHEDPAGPLATPFALSLDFGVVLEILYRLHTTLVSFHDFEQNSSGEVVPFLHLLEPQ